MSGKRLELMSGKRLERTIRQRASRTRHLGPPGIAEPIEMITNSARTAP